MNIRFKHYFALLSCGTALALAGCGQPDNIDLLGIKPGMTRDEVSSMAPSGSALYCQGDGDPTFDQVAQLTKSTELKFCTWASVDSTGNRSRFQLQFDNATSSTHSFAFGLDGKLRFFMIEIPGNAYGAIVKSLSNKLGTPQSPVGLPEFIGGDYWDAKDGTLTASKDDSRSYITILMLQAVAAQR